MRIAASTRRQSATGANTYPSPHIPASEQDGGRLVEGMARQLDFRDHRRELDDNRYVYAVVSRRSRGLSVGINLNPDKVCNFDCPYCQVDRTVPGADRRVDLQRLRAEMDHLLDLVVSGTLWSVTPFSTADPAFRRLNDLAFAGDGEPTSSAVFAESVSVVADARDAHGLSEVPLHLLTNATLLHRPKVRRGLEALDARGGVIWAKLDAGTEAYFRLVDGTTLPFRRVLDNIVEAARRAPLVLQCMFPTLDGQGPTDDEIDAWAARISEILSAGGQILEVQVYSVARRPADPRVGTLDVPRLERIAARAATLGVPVRVYPGLG